LCDREQRWFRPNGFREIIPWGVLDKHAVPVATSSHTCETHRMMNVWLLKIFNGMLMVPRHDESS
jgi:hypothetical protein